MRPAAGEIDLALEVLDAIDLRRFWRREAAGGHDVIAAGYCRAIVGREQPAFRALIPVRRGHLGTEADVAPQLVSVGDEAEVAQDLRLGGVFLRPLPRVLQFRIERVAVVDGLDVAACAGIAVPVPGAADVAGLLDHGSRKAGLAQAMQEIEAGKPGADDRDVDLLRLAAARCFRRTCDRCVWHANPPVCFTFWDRLLPRVRFVIRTMSTPDTSRKVRCSGDSRSTYSRVFQFEAGLTRDARPNRRVRRSLLRRNSDQIAIATLPKCAPLSIWANACFAWSNEKILSITGFMRLAAMRVRHRLEILDRSDGDALQPLLLHDHQRQPQSRTAAVPRARR